jgi:uncharacterized protein
MRLSQGLVFDKNRVREYHPKVMTAPTTIDSLAFARAGGRMVDDIAIQRFPRLVGSLASDSGTVHFELRGSIQEGRPVLELAVEADVRMICQYCLEAYDQPIANVSAMPIALDESQLDRWEQDDPLIDAILQDAHLDVHALVEDELLLSLPVVPKHPTGACRLGVRV